MTYLIRYLKDIITSTSCTSTRRCAVLVCSAPGPMTSYSSNRGTIHWATNIVGCDLLTSAGLRSLSSREELERNLKRHAFVDRVMISFFLPMTNRPKALDTMYVHQHPSPDILASIKVLLAPMAPSAPKEVPLLPPDRLPKEYWTRLQIPQTIRPRSHLPLL